MCTKDPSSQKYTALEYINIFGVIPENANEDHRKSRFTCHSSKGHRADVSGGVENKSFHAGWHRSHGGSLQISTQNVKCTHL